MEEIQGERCPKEKVVKCSQLRTRGTLTLLASLQQGNPGGDTRSGSMGPFASVKACLRRIDRSSSRKEY